MVRDIFTEELIFKKTHEGLIGINQVKSKAKQYSRHMEKLELNSWNKK